MDGPAPQRRALDSKEAEVGQEAPHNESGSPKEHDDVPDCGRTSTQGPLPFHPLILLQPATEVERVLFRVTSADLGLKQSAVAGGGGQEGFVAGL